MAVDQPPIAIIATRVPREGPLGVAVEHQFGDAERGVRLDLRADRPDLRRDLTIGGQRTKPLDQRHERVAVRLPRVVRLRPVAEDQDLGLAERVVEAAVIVVSVVSSVFEGPDFGRPLAFQEGLQGAPNAPEAPVIATRRPRIREAVPARRSNSVIHEL